MTQLTLSWPDCDQNHATKAREALIGDVVIAVARFWLAFAPKEELEYKRHLVPEWHAKGNAALGVMQTHLARHDWFAGGRYSAPVYQSVRARCDIERGGSRGDAQGDTHSS